jgi:hypothetical protein
MEYKGARPSPGGYVAALIWQVPTGVLPARSRPNSPLRTKGRRPPQRTKCESCPARRRGSHSSLSVVISNARLGCRFGAVVTGCRQTEFSGPPAKAFSPPERSDAMSLHTPPYDPTRDFGGPPGEDPKSTVQIILLPGAIPRLTPGRLILPIYLCLSPAGPGENVQRACWRSP